MNPPIERVAVLGAGTMGAAIAAHVANAGLPVLLLDVVPTELLPEEEKRGLTLESPAVRNRVVRQGLERTSKARPASFMSAAAAKLVALGNFEDDFGRLSDADWIVEAVVERLDVKRELMARVDGVRRPGTLVTTNTSGLPIASIAEGLSVDFRRCFFGAHFFNPPRYMKLLEIIRGEEADPLAVSALAEFASQTLGKGVVFTRDTPNFIGNRIMSIHGSHVIDYALEHGYRVEEVDAVTGPLLGRPKTATFRLQDLVGLDVAAFVGRNLHELIPDDPQREVLRSPRLEQVLGALIERGHLGNKTGAGFYRKTKGAGGKPVYQVLNLETLEHEDPREVRFEAVEAVRGIADLGERLRALTGERHAGDRGAQLAWAATSQLLGYAADVAQEIAFDLASLDNAVRWGFGYELGPFELWDRLGVAAIVERMEEGGFEVAEWVKEMLFAEIETFYRTEDGEVTGYYDWQTKRYADRHVDERHVEVQRLRSAAEPVAANPSASLHDMDDGVLLLEIHSKMNAIDDDVVAMMVEARRQLESDAWYGLVIGNDGPNFSVGANLKRVGAAALSGDFDGIKQATGSFQSALQGLRYGSKPTVAAVHGMALGGGAEIALGASRIVAHAESYVGLVEAGVGLLPAGGGLKELVRRLVTPAVAQPLGDPLPAAQRVLETVAMAKVSTSAAEAREMGFLGVHDRVVMNRDHLLYEAKQEVLQMVADGYLAPPPAEIYAAGRDLLAALEIAVWSLVQAGWASEHDALVARKIAFVVAGGDLSSPARVGDDYFLALEREAFAELVATEKTQARIEHMLKTGKPLRN